MNNGKFSVKIEVPIDYSEDLRSIIMKEYEEIKDKKYISDFKIRSSDINGLNNEIVENAKVLITALGGGSGIAAIISAIAYGIANFMKSRNVTVSIKNNNKEIVLEGDVEKIIDLINEISREG